MVWHMMDINFEIIWSQHQYIVFAPVLFFVAGCLIYTLVRTKKILAFLVEHSRAPDIVRYGSMKRKYAKAILFYIGSVFLFCAILGPRWGNKNEVVHQEGRDLLIALDISKSMLAGDCEPDRLRCAKNKIKKLLSLLSCERVGLILFSGSAFVQCPLTSDYSAFTMFLDQVDVETIASGGTALDQALKHALHVYRNAPDKKHKLLVVFTDGEDFSSNLAQVKQKALEQGVHISIIGVGTKEGAPIPLFDRTGKQIGHQEDEDGSIVISRLNEEFLYNVAIDSGGTYTTITKTSDDLDQVVAQVSSFEKEAFEDKHVTHMQERYYYFVLVSFICFLCEWLL